MSLHGTIRLDLSDTKYIRGFVANGGIFGEAQIMVKDGSKWRKVAKIGVTDKETAQALIAVLEEIAGRMR